MAGRSIVRSGDFIWALAHAGVGDDGSRIDGGGRRYFDGGRCRLARGPGMIGLREGGALTGPAAITSGLVASSSSAMAGGAVSPRGQPAAPAASGGLTGGATVAGLGPARQEPALTSLEQAAAAAGMPATGSGRLTRDQGVGRLGTAHGRRCSRVVRRRGGDTSRRPPAPTAATTAVDTGATGTHQTMGGADTCQGGRDRNEERAKAAIDRSRSGSTGSAIVAHFLTAADTYGFVLAVLPGSQPIPITLGGPLHDASLNLMQDDECLGWIHH
jgi:hypothetical protein